MKNKRILSMLLTLTMLLSLLPGQALAARVETGGETICVADIETVRKAVSFATSANHAHVRAVGSNVDTYPASSEEKGFFGSQLSGNAAKFYEALWDNIDKIRKGKAVRVELEKKTFTSDDSTTSITAFVDKSANSDLLVGLDEAVAAFDRDRSDVFWTSGMNSGTYSSKDGVDIKGSYYPTAGTYAVGVDITLPISASWSSERNIATDEATVTSKIEEIIKTIPTGADTYIKLRTVHDWLTKNNLYNSTAANTSNYIKTNSTPWEAISALDSSLSPVCEGYARAFKLICDKLGIPCVLISGESSGNGTSGDHMWTYVRMDDNKWYAVDVTWDDPTVSGNDNVVSGSERYTYFLVGKNVMDTGHTNSSDDFLVGGHTAFGYPTLNDTAYTPPGPVVTYSTVPDALTIGTPMSPTVQVSVIGGTSPYTYSMTGAPDGITINARTGVISGTPTTYSATTTTATITVTDSSSPAQTATATITFPAVDKMDNAVTFTSPTATFYKDGDTDPGISFTATHNGTATPTYQYKVKDADDSTYNDAAPTGVGEYTVKAGVTGDPKYADASKTFDFSIVAKAVTEIKVTTQPSKTNYVVGESIDTTDMVVTATYNDNTTGVLSSGYSLSTDKAQATAGTQTITVTYDADTNITTTFVITVTDLPLQVFNAGFDTAESKTYGDGNYTRSATLTTGDGRITYSSSNTAVATVDSNTGMVTIVGAGQTTITATAVQTANYAETSVSYTLTVSPKTLTAADLEQTSGSSSKTYDGTTSATGITVGVKSASLVNAGDRVAVTGTAVYNSKDVASANSIIFTTSAITTGNYALAAAETLTIKAAITAKAITVTVTPVSRVYGAANPAFTGTTTGLAAGDTYTGLDMTFSTSADENSNVGSYDVIGSGANTNYAVTVSGSGALTVTQAVPDYTVNTDAQVKMGSNLAAFTAAANAPASGTGVSSATVNGTLNWYSDSGRTTLAQESDVSDLAIGATKTLYWRFAPSDGNYSAVEGATTFTTVEGDPQGLSFSSPQTAATYGDGNITGNTATLTQVTDNSGGTISYESSNTAVAAVDGSTGEITIVGAGTTTITANVTAVPGVWAAATQSYTLTVNPKGIEALNADATNRQYDGTTDVTVTAVTFNDVVAGDTLTLGRDYTAVGELADANASDTAKPFTATVTLLNDNYTLTDATADGTVTISKADAPTLSGSGSFVYTVTGAQSITISGLPTDPGTIAYTVGTVTDAEAILTGTPTVANGVVGFELSGSGEDGDKATIFVKVEMTNYETATVDVDIVITDKLDQATLSITGGTSVTYGQSLTLGTSGGSGSGAVAWTVTNGTGSATISGGVLTPTGVGTVTVTATKAADDTYLEATTTTTISITKAPSTVTPTYTEIYGSGQTLAAAGLGLADGSTPGTIKWDLEETTVVEANTAYTWTFTPDDPNYTTESGSILLWTYIEEPTRPSTRPGSPSRPGGSTGDDSGSGDASLPVNTGDDYTADGVVTSTVATPEADVSGGTATSEITSLIGQEIVDQAVENGSTEVIIAPDMPAGVTSTAVSLPAATVGDLGERTEANLTVSTPVADVTIPNGGLDDLAHAGGSVTVSAEKIGSTVILEVSADGENVEALPGGITLTVPHDSCTPGTVAVLVSGDGAQEVIPWSVADDGSMTVTVPLEGSAQIVLIENGKSFSDVTPSDWEYGAVEFATARDLYQGVGEGKFAPDDDMTRAMVLTVLARLDGQATTGGAAWYEPGVQWAITNAISDGSGLQENVTREQLAVMLWRYAGSPVSAGSIGGFNDADQISDWAEQALRWAVEHGVIGGKGGGILDPKGFASRAEVAQMIKNFIENFGS